MNIIGHKKIQERLLRSIEKNTMSHSFLFVGPESVGKFEVAKYFAGQLIDDNGFDGSASSGYPIDLLVLEPMEETEKKVMKQKDISIEQVRETERRLKSAPYAGKKKVLIVRDAHRLTESAQNALLKTLEEPMPYAVIILVTHRLEKILPTIVSRCQKIAFDLVGKEDMKGFFSESEADSDSAFLLSLGRPGLAVNYKAKEKTILEDLSILKRLFFLHTLSLQERLVLAELLSKDARLALRVLEYWMNGLHMNMKSRRQFDVGVFSQMEKVQEALQGLQSTPSSARLIIENIFVHWK